MLVQQEWYIFDLINLVCVVFGLQTHTPFSASPITSLYILARRDLIEEAAWRKGLTFVAILYGSLCIA